MMRIRHSRRGGFTLVEISISALLMVIVLAMSMRGFLYVLRGSSRNMAQDELDIEVQVSMERIKRDLRLSSMSMMSFAPENSQQFTAMSFPMARDDDGDGAVDLSDDDEIIWDKQMVYHVWDSSPNQLRLTVFDPRDSSLTAAQRQAQVEHVLKYGSGSGTHNGDSATSIVVFENLFDWTLKPSGTQYDAYAKEMSRDINVPLGTAVLDSGPHTITFKMVDKNLASSGYKFGIDTLTMSPSYGERQGEAQLPHKAVSGPAPVAAYRPNGSWSGNYDLHFPATAKDQYFTLELDNDRWEETNFRMTGQSTEDTFVEFNESLSPKDFVIALSGITTNWEANLVTGDTTGRTPDYDAMSATAVRVLLPGRNTGETGTLSGNGRDCRVTFKSGEAPTQGLRIQYAYIAEAASGTNLTMDTVAGTEKLLKFGGSTWGIVNPGTSLQSDWSGMSIDDEKSYIVSHLVYPLAGWSNPWQWDMAYSNSSAGCYVIPSNSAPAQATLISSSWSSRSDVIETNCIYGVASLMVSYPEKGLYTSGIYDTHLDTPSYNSIGWNSVMPAGCSVGMRVRSASSNDMSDAQAWTNITAMSVPGSLSISSKRYVQFQAELGSSNDGLLTPLLKDVVITWPGESTTVDISGTFTRSSDYGIAEIEVDGEPLRSAVVIDLEIFDDIRAYGYPQRITSTLTAEIMPLNTVE